MAVKFIDKNRKDEFFGDEIILRCSCGCGMVSFSIFEDTDANKDNERILVIQYFGNSITNRKKAIASCLYYPGIQAPNIIANLINGAINNGRGVIKDVDGSILMIERNKDEELGDSLLMAGFYDEKNFKKYMKNPMKGLKYLAWNIHLEPKESNKFIDLSNKFFNKGFGYEVPKEENKELYTENLFMPGM